MVGVATRNTSDKDIKNADLYNPAQEQANKTLELTAVNVAKIHRVVVVRVVLKLVQVVRAAAHLHRSPEYNRARTHT